MRVEVPPGQDLAEVTAHVSLSQEEAAELRDALDLVLGTGESGWAVSVAWGGMQTDVRLSLDLGSSFQLS